ncbi:transglutaminase family protein [Denitromonas iodatirespirans]|uniref:Transglutaminase family protein n=1 Tax=Denitromonas iodatirespirans TaxID=2795389 RepID=A0A944H7S6_DENI1|nr:transglutaminase family protein [Denitromonas iodatirespirans]MBT0961553.1 transglutaminase family protein [Denitromonas iodatirespirans]
MSIHVALNHVTEYHYDRPVKLGPQVIRLRPCPHSRTPIRAYSLKVTPDDYFLNWQQDPQSNWLARLVFPNPTESLRIEVDVVAEMSVINPFDFFLEPHAEEIPFTYEAWQRHELAPYLYCLPLTDGSAPLFAKYLDSVDRTPTRSVDFLVAINQRVQQDIAYTIRLEPGVQTPEETLEKRLGSCRDSAWLLVQLLRHLGLAARFVSGYLIQLTPDVKSLDGPQGTEVDFTDLHAWCEVYLPGAGWIGLDPTSGLFAGEGHIPLSCTPEPASAAPITGAVDECEVEFAHSMEISRIHEAPRVTKPYTEAQWSAIEALGHRIDEVLVAEDVRLTMGGEPTFVSIDDPDGAEWNTEALGPTKRLLAADVFHRLREKYAPNGLTHFGQGKWYPGEQLPRWSLNCFWRTDGEPIWHNPALMADEKKNDGVNADTAARFLRKVAEHLGLAARHVFPAFEDVYYYLWRERKLPVNVDPFDSRLKDPLERERLRQVFDRGLDAAIGHVLPVAKDPASGRWRSGEWFLRNERCYLIPGDSPVGYRLPIDSQPWVKESDYPHVLPPDPMQAHGALPPRVQITEQLRARRQAHLGLTATPVDMAHAPTPGESADWITRLAMCAEPRDGRLYVFMPPTETLEDYLELVAAVEAAAESMNQPVILEGYEPPKDPRITVFRVTPDPGVIEVNIHPAGRWDELVERSTHLYEAARLSRLSTEKFMIDGRHTGTGGGNHFVLGGATPADSPFLRRPDLLASLIAYWHNHPSLSYLFSGLFIGPSSQAPRVDEARNDSLYELELAFRQMPDASRESLPWQVDRLLRNLLIDVTGNTHRAEFCIDKLYSPDGATGRLGLLELRAFEMPPHAQMSLAQQLLLRALVARFWQTPYRPDRLARWGTELHDRFMLPHFVAQDFHDVIEETRNAGFPLEFAWFAPHLEFRFPRHGEFTVRGMTVEVRHALEPWHVMGEEGAAGGAVRFVDSSVERLQIKVTGMAPDRYRLTCNGEAVPLQNTGTVGEYVAGIRYRAWQPPSCLHPLIGVHAPLVFDLVDTWSQRSLGGCQYHVAHPGGRSFETFPVNAFEAESRRLARFFAFGHTPGKIEAPAVTTNPEFPFTLDLRRH